MLCREAPPLATWDMRCFAYKDSATFSSDIHLRLRPPAKVPGEFHVHVLNLIYPAKYDERARIRVSGKELVEVQGPKGRSMRITAERSRSLEIRELSPRGKLMVFVLNVSPVPEADYLGFVKHHRPPKWGRRSTIR